ncbi:hypothetical protein ACP70R_000337 [Stipagrostis hirtigluma subsp. patula]
MAPPGVPGSDRVVRRTAMVGAATAAFFLLTSDYGPNYPNPIRKAMESSALFSQSDRNVHLREKKQESSEPDGDRK